MADCARPWGWVVGRLAIVSVLCGISLLLGCNREKPTAPEAEGDNEPTAKTLVMPAVKETANVDTAPATVPIPQSLADAAIVGQVPDGQTLVDRTLNGESVGKLYSRVVSLWDNIRFLAANGKPIEYTATLETELGNIEIALRPDIAPNHVRSFVALSLAGYYDGLVFEKIVSEQSDSQPGSKVQLIEAGCPAGTGDPGFGSIGYWLKPEFKKSAVHEEGTVGAWHEEEADTAACRFYISLSKAPLMDGNYTVFGRVVAGMNVAHKIFGQPMRHDEEYPQGDHPAKPVIIHRVTIHTK